MNNKDYDFRNETGTWQTGRTQPPKRYVGLIAFLLVDIRICNAAGSTLGYLKIGAYAIGAVAVILYLYLIPVMAAFQDTLPHLIRNAFYFFGKKPWKAVVILFFDIFPFVLTFSDLQSLPLYAFLWVLCGFGLQAMLAVGKLQWSPTLMNLPKNGVQQL